MGERPSPDLLPSEEGILARFYRPLPENQGQNPALSLLYVPDSLQGAEQPASQPDAAAVAFLGERLSPDLLPSENGTTCKVL